MVKTFVMKTGTLSEPDKDYTRGLSECECLDDLRALVTAYEPLAIDAKWAVDAMTDADFAVFAKGLKRERRGKFAGEAFAERYGAVMMPMPMMRISMLANEYKAPFGVTWMRCRELRPDLLVVERTS